MSDDTAQLGIDVPAQPPAPEPEAAPKRARAPRARKPRKAASERAPRRPSDRSPRKPSESQRIADALDKLVPFLALRDPYAAAVIRKRRVELAKALVQIPVLGDLVKWLARVEASTDNPYVVLLSVLVPIAAHHGWLGGTASPVAGMGASLLGLAPSQSELDAVSGEAAAVVMSLGALGSMMAEADAARAAEQAAAAA